MPDSPHHTREFDPNTTPTAPPSKAASAGTVAPVVPVRTTTTPSLPADEPITLPPTRTQELADRSYTMHDYVWFRVAGKLPDLPFPYYVGRGSAFSTKYNIDDVYQEPMPEHVVVKIALSKGGAVAVNSQKRVVRPGEAILRFVEDPEIWEGYHPNHRGPWEFLGFIFSGRAAVTVARALIHRYGRIYPLSLDNLIIRRLKQFTRETDHVAEVSASHGVKLVNDVLTALLDVAEADMTDRSGRLADLAETAESTIRNDIGREWSVAELASVHGVSREHLTRVFTQRYGVPPHRYSVEMRIQEACKRLRTTEEPIKNIMLSLGFKSHASFIRAFRRYNGMSPTAYREERG